MKFDIFFLSTLTAVHDYLQNYDFVVVIIRDFSTTIESPKHHFTLVSLNFLFESFKLLYPTTSNS